MAKSNIFNASAAEILALFDEYLSGAQNGAVLALSTRPLGESTRFAIARSAEKFGYGTDACTFAALLPTDTDDDKDIVPLDPQALFLLVEGLDPLCVICADERATECLGRAFRESYPLDATIRAFGRSGVAFRNLDALLSDEAGKQQAWHLLKSLPKR